MPREEGCSKKEDFVLKVLSFFIKISMKQGLRCILLYFGVKQDN